MTHNSVCITVNIPSGAQMHEMQIYAQNPARFATNVCSGEGITCAVNYLLSRKVIISH